MTHDMVRVLVGLLLGASAVAVSGAGALPDDDWQLVIHGGAGGISPESLTGEREGRMRETLERALQAGGTVLRAGGTSVEAVQAAIVVLEDSPLFNAGKGAVFNAAGANELDASIMRGEDLEAGAVAGVGRIRNPVLAAHAVMVASPHVMLAGTGAEQFAADHDIELVKPEYFRTEERWQQLQRVRGSDGDGGDGDFGTLDVDDQRLGTVGAVARNAQGHLAAATSTGGMTNKRYGRVGDSPIIGAGTYADDRSCAVSATGHGEYFIRLSIARTICALVEFGGMNLAEAAQEVIGGRLTGLGGEGGVIAIDASGTMVAEFNTTGMYRGWISAGGPSEVRIFQDE
jgi:beta-aspartyl-peptidase (threonine type)